MAVAGEVAAALQDALCGYQTDTERLRRENQRLRKELSKMKRTSHRKHTADDKTDQLIPEEPPSITHGPLDSGPSIIQVKVELSTMKQDLDPQPTIPDPTTLTSSPSAASEHRCDPVLTEQNLDDGSHDAFGLMIKPEPWAQQVVHSHHSGSLIQISSETIHHSVDPQPPDVSPQCPVFYDAGQNQSTEGPVSCEFCRKQFRNRFQLKKHMVVHQKERPRPYRCDLCGKCYPSPQVLEVHHRTHTGERPYRCQFCGRRFNQQSHLNDHERIHTGEKPFGCPVCGKRFVQSSHVRKHMNYHLQNK